ncbi:hypothetical protein ACHWQZ_G010683 [Mnemiopsis leidyi]
MFSSVELKNLLESLYFIVGNRVLQPILSFFFAPRTSEASKNNLASFRILADIKPHFEVHHRDKRSFLLKFGGWKDLAYLEREDVTLHSVSEDEFVFVRTKPGIDLYNTEEHPFVYEIQHTAAVELLTAPHNTVFEYLRSKPARDGSNISFLYNTGRSGSTLMAAMMYKTKQFVVQSEPNSILQLALIFNDKDFVISRNTTEYVYLVWATFLLTCPDPNKRYFIKPFPCYTISLFPLIKQALPGITELFNYRSILPSLISCKKLFGYNLTRAANRGMLLLPFNYKNIWKKIKPECDVGEKAFALQLLITVHAFLLETRDREDIKTFSYESLVKDKEEFTVRLLKEVGVGEKFLSDALSALEYHSQAKSDTVNRLTYTSRIKENTVSDGCVEWIRKIAYEELEIEIDKETGRYSALE